jgi:glucokinase
VYLGGGIAPHVLPALRARAFLEAFAAKGRVRALLEALPVRVVLNDRAALIGAARRAAIEAGLLE